MSRAWGRAERLGEQDRLWSWADWVQILPLPQEVTKFLCLQSGTIVCTPPRSQPPHQVAMRTKLYRGISDLRVSR